MISIIKDITVINEGEVFSGTVIIEDEKISGVLHAAEPDYTSRCRRALLKAERVIEGEGSILIPGVIDDQVHFREPGATHKGDLFSESRAALLGGTTSYMDMPNNTPPAVTLEGVEWKYSRAAEVSVANYSFYIGATNDNLDQIKKTDPHTVCGVKLFMGSSTGNMLVDSQEAIEALFRESPLLIAAHCEEESLIRKALSEAKERFGTTPEGKSLIPFSEHPHIRSRQACISSTKKAIDLAVRHSSRLHILHISTAEELGMILEAKKRNPAITAEVCVHYMWWDDSAYTVMGSKVKCNPAIKSAADREAIIGSVRESKADAVATDHAPHLLSEKEGDYLSAPSGLPTVQYSLLMMTELAERGAFSMTKVVEAMCHKPAETFRVKKRGYIREGYYADLVILKREAKVVSKKDIASKCGWSPLEGHKFGFSVSDVFVNGAWSVRNGMLTEELNPHRLIFE